MMDDSVDAKARHRGDNPMSKSYQKEVAERRQKMGLKPLRENGMVRYDDSQRYIKEKLQRLLTKQDKKLKAEIKELIDVEFDFKKFTERLNSYDNIQYYADRRKKMAERYGADNV